jgi:hypothetical protein
VASYANAKKSRTGLAPDPLLGMQAIGAPLRDISELTGQRALAKNCPAR